MLSLFNYIRMLSTSQDPHASLLKIWIRYLRGLKNYDVRGCAIFKWEGL